MTDHNLRFSGSSFTEQGSFKLMELSPELCKLMEASIENGGSSSPFHIKGQSGEDAVLCTADKTFTIRSVTLSNSILVVTSPPDSDISLLGDDDSLANVVVRDQLNEILEVNRVMPKLHKLNTLLKGREYGEDEEENDDSMYVDRGQGFTYAHAQAMIQASEAELNRGLRDRRILQINGSLRPLSSAYLTKIIQFLLNSLAAMSLDHESVPIEKLSATLADEHEVPRTVSLQVMGWFGDLNEVDGKWKMDVEAVVKEAGLGLLKESKDKPLEEDALLLSWKELVGDKFASLVALDLLAGNYLLIPASSYSIREVVKYFPASSLPIDPAQRFSDLFVTRSRWKNEDITPFLMDIAVDGKERDKLLLKYARAITDAEGVWYTARTQYNG